MVELDTKLVPSIRASIIVAAAPPEGSYFTSMRYHVSLDKVLELLPT